MLDRFKNSVVALRPLVLPVYSMHFMLDRFKNPVVALELSKRYKNAAYVVVMITVYAMYAVYAFLVLVIVFGRTWRITRLYHLNRYWDFGDLLGFTVGWAVWPVVFMIFLIVPVLAAVSVVGERRRGTLMPVQLSSLRPFDIVWGKVVASVAPVLFPIVVYAVVLYSFSLFYLVLDRDDTNVYRLFGSVIGGAGMVAGMVAGLVVLSVAVSVVCVLCSTFAKSSASAITMSYGLFFGLFFSMLFEATWYDIPVLSLGVWIVGLPFWCLWACKRLRLPGH